MVASRLLENDDPPRVILEVHDKILGRELGGPSRTLVVPAQPDGRGSLEGFKFNEAADSAGGRYAAPRGQRR